MHDEVDFSVLVGMTLQAVNVATDKIVFTTSDGRRFQLMHEQDCCEHVVVEDVIGHIEDIIGRPILLAEEVSSSDRPSDLPPPEYEAESETWTFYKLATVRGDVTIRFYGSSNGYYSEAVSFVQLADAE